MHFLPSIVDERAEGMLSIFLILERSAFVEIVSSVSMPRDDDYLRQVSDSLFVGDDLDFKQNTQLETA